MKKNNLRIDCTRYAFTTEQWLDGEVERPCIQDWSSYYFLNGMCRVDPTRQCPLECAAEEVISKTPNHIFRILDYTEDTKIFKENTQLIYLRPRKSKDGLVRYYRNNAADAFDVKSHSNFYTRTEYVLKLDGVSNLVSFSIVAAKKMNEKSNKNYQNSPKNDTSKDVQEETIIDLDKEYTYVPFVEVNQNVKCNVTIHPE